MIAMTPLEQACEAFLASQTRMDELQLRQIQVDSAVALGEWGIFSNWNIAHITGLEYAAVQAITGKSDKTGGRLAPASLPLMLDLRAEFIQTSTCSARTIRSVIALGTSVPMIAKLIGIPRSTLYLWSKR